MLISNETSALAVGAAEQRSKLAYGEQAIGLRNHRYEATLPKKRAYGYAALREHGRLTACVIPRHTYSVLFILETDTYDCA